MHGKIIMFDGPDGVGKTTQIEHVRDELTGEGRTVQVTRAHGGTPMGEALRDISLNDELPRLGLTDYFISLAIHSELAQDVKRRKANNEIVLIDRSPMSIWAYQVYGSEVPAEELAHGIDADMQRFDADLVVCYEASLATLRAHMSQRDVSKQDYFESKPDSYFKRVIEGYDFAAKRYGALVINAETTIEEVHTASMRAIADIL